MPLARKYAERAVQLDANLAEAHASMGLALTAVWDLKGAEPEYSQAIKLKPNYATVHHWYALLLGHLGFYEEAYEQEKKAYEQEKKAYEQEKKAYEQEKKAYEPDPYSSVVSQGVGIALLQLGRGRESIAQFEKLVETDPEFSSGRFWKAWAHEWLGESDLAVEEAKNALKSGEGDNYPLRMSLVSLYLRAGMKEEAEELVHQIESEPANSYRPPTAEAMVKFDLGRKDEAFVLLEKALAEHDGFLFYIKGFPWFSQYRTDPRWLEIERRMGLAARNSRQ